MILRILLCALVILSFEHLPAKDALPLGEKYVYKTVDDRPLYLYVLRPPIPQTSPAPVIVFFHGGGWTKGAPGLFNDQARQLSARGLVCIQVEYRLLPKDSVETPANCIEDAKSSVRWIRAHARELGIDPDRLAACGSSAGGQMAAFLGLMPGFDAASDNLEISSRPQALILLNPVLDNGPQGYGYPRTGPRYLEFSPYHNIRAGAPPTIILTGQDDKLVSAEMILDFQKQMSANADLCHVVIYPGQVHGFYRLSKSGGKYFWQTLTEITNFLTRLGWSSAQPSNSSA